MIKKMFLGMALLLGLASCNHKELCYHHPHTGNIRIDVDWSEFTEETPTGMSVMAFPVAGGKPVTVLSNTLSHVYMNLEAGLYHTLVYNQSPSEFGSLTFNNMENYKEAEVAANIISSKWYTGRAGETRVATEPEWFAVNTEENVRVTEEMVEAARQEEIKQHRATNDFVISSLMPKNIIYKINVKVNIKGIYNLRSARAAMDGISGAVKFATLERSGTNLVTHLMEEWEITIDKTDPTKGYITSSFYCLGLPSNHQGQAEENYFLLSCLLVDNKTKLDFPFDVGHMVKKLEDGRLVLNLEIDVQEALPDVKPVDGSAGGFDATVDDWGDDIEHDVQM